MRGWPWQQRRRGARAAGLRGVPAHAAHCQRHPELCRRDGPAPPGRDAGRREADLRPSGAPGQPHGQRLLGVGSPLRGPGGLVVGHVARRRRTLFRAQPDRRCLRAAQSRLCRRRGDCRTRVPAAPPAGRRPGPRRASRAAGSRYGHPAGHSGNRRSRPRERPGRARLRPRRPTLPTCRSRPRTPSAPSSSPVGAPAVPRGS